MKIKLSRNGFYITNVGTGVRNGKCKLDYLWVGSDSQAIGYVSEGNLKKLKKTIDKMLENKKTTKGEK